MKDSSDLTTAIDSDLGLQSKRKLLTVASLILLALSFSGATIDEANTFIFKIKFANQNGLGILLVLSIIFLMIRYYNYAKPYLDRLYKIWSDRLFNDPFFYQKSHHDDEDAGLLAMSRNSELDAGLNYDVRRWSFSYKCGMPFCRYIVHYWGYNEHPDEERSDSVNIYKTFGLKVYFKVIVLEVTEQTRSFFTHRENLDIFAPFILGCLAIASYYFNKELLGFLLFFTPSKGN